MEIFADSEVNDKENQILRNKEIITFESIYGRTPLRDRKNDTKVFLSQLTSSNKCEKSTSLVSKCEASNLSAPGTPKRKQRIFKERRSCIPSFRAGIMFNSEGTVPGITLPQMSEEEPDVYSQVALTKRHEKDKTPEGRSAHTSSASVVPILHSQSKHFSPQSGLSVLHNQSLYCADQIDLAGELTVAGRDGQEEIPQSGELSSSDLLKISETEVRPKSNCSEVDITCDPTTGSYAIHFTKNCPDVLVDVTTERSSDQMDNVTTDRSTDPMDNVTTDRSTDPIDNNITTDRSTDQMDNITTDRSTDQMDNVTTDRSTDQMDNVTTNRSSDPIENNVTTDASNDQIDNVITDGFNDHMDYVKTDHSYAVPVQQCYSQWDVSSSCQISSQTVTDHCFHLPVNSFHTVPPFMAFKEIPNDANLERVNYSEFIETYSNSDDSYFEELSESTIERLLEIEHTPRISNHRDLQNSPVNNELNDNQETADVLTDESAEKTISRPSVPFANRQLLHEDSFSTNTIKWDSKASNSCRLSQDFVNSLSVTHHSEMEACDILSQDDCDVTQCCQTPHTNMALCQSLSAPACGDDMTSPSRPLVRGSQQVNHHRWSASQVTTFTNKYTNSDNEVSPELGEMMENLIHTHMLDASCQVDDDMALRADIVDTCDLSMMAVPLLVNTSSLTEPCQVTDVSMITDHTEPCQVTDVSMITDHPETLDYSMMAVPDVVNKLTMTDKKLVMDICSSMTPIKIAKQGQRLTADSVRQLHPRTLANQLDTLMTVNERLEKEVKSSVQEMVHLKAELRVVKSKLLDVEKQLELEKLGQSKHITMLEDLHEEATLGLQACIQEKQATIYNLEQELKCSQEKRKEAEVRLITLEQDLADKIETLQQLQAESKCHFETELVKLRRRYDESNSKRQLESSLQIIQELQAEKTELLEVFDDLERNVTLQFQLADGLFLLDKKVKGSAWKNRQEHEQLVFEFDNMKKKYNSQQEELENLSSENRELQVDIQNLSDILNRSNKCLVEMEVMYKNVNEELKESKDKVSYYSNELMATIQALEELTEKQDLLTQQLMELQDSRNKLSQALVQAEKKVFKLEQVHMEQEQLCDVSKQIENKKREDDELSKSKLEQHIENLLHTLDSLEVNKEVTEQELYELREQMLSDRIKMEEMASELDMLHKVLATFETEKEQVEELKHTIKMLEAEKKLCMEAIGDLRSQLETEVDLHKNNRRLVDSLQTNNSILQGSYQSLKSEARRLDETLSLKMLDIDASSTALSSLEDKMDLMLTNLQEKLGLEVTCEEDKKRSNNATQRKPNLSFQQGDSLVAFILSHVNTPSLQSPGNTSNMSGGNQSRQDPSREWINRPKQCNVSCDDLEPRARDGAPQGNGYGGREENEVNSTELGYPWDISGLDFTFSAIKTPARKSGTQKQGESEELSSSTPRFANIRRIPTTVDRVKDVTSRVTSDGQHRAAGTLFSDRDGSDSLLFKVKNVDRKFHHIEKLTEKAERTSKLTIADLTAEMDVLSNKVQFQKNHITQLESDLTKMTHLLNSKNTEIKDLCTRVKAMNESILNFHDQKLENKRLEEDKKELQYRVEDLRGQVALLTEQLDDFTKKLSYSREPDIISAREILSLKKKNHEGIMKLFMEREKNQELGEKAMRRMKILESNWQKAEAEVKKLDDLLEAVRQACIDSQCQSKVPIVLHIIRLLDGLV